MPEHGLEAGCNYAIAGALLAVLAGASVMLYEAGSSRPRGHLFREMVDGFYPWDTEPSDGVTDPALGAAQLWRLFRNPLAHSFGFSKTRQSRDDISRLWQRGLTEQEVESIESASERPAEVLTGAPTLLRETTWEC